MDTPIAVPWTPSPLPTGRPVRACWIIATHHRPELLAEVLICAMSQHVPPGWDISASVAGAPDDPGREVCESMARAGNRVTYTPTDEIYAGHRWQVAIDASDADVVMLTGDDDLQASDRLERVAAAWAAGARWTSEPTVRFASLVTGESALWIGEPRYVGSAMAWDRRELDAAGGVPTHIRQGLDGAISARLHERGIPCHVIAGRHPVLCLQHLGNMWPRPFPGRGEVMDGGQYELIGEGSVVTGPADHWKVAPSLDLCPMQRGRLAHLIRKNIDWTDHLAGIRPHLADGAIDALAAWAAPRCGCLFRVLEWGSGDSTVWWAQRASEVRAIEHNVLWAQWGAQRLRALHGAGLAGDWQEVVLVGASDLDEDDMTYQGIDQQGRARDYRDYVHADVGIDTYDVVVVDGRARNRCIERAIREDLVEPGGLLVLDDSQRERYAEGIAAVPATWARVDYPGLSWTTTIWTRPATA